MFLAALLMLGLMMQRYAWRGLITNVPNSTASMGEVRSSMVYNHLRLTGREGINGRSGSHPIQYVDLNVAD
jgi:hypothetical protein